MKINKIWQAWIVLNHFIIKLQSIATYFKAFTSNRCKFLLCVIWCHWNVMADEKLIFNPHDNKFQNVSFFSRSIFPTKTCFSLFEMNMITDMLSYMKWAQVASLQQCLMLDKKRITFMKYNNDMSEKPHYFFNEQLRWQMISLVERMYSVLLTENKLVYYKCPSVQ